MKYSSLYDFKIKSLLFNTAQPLKAEGSEGRESGHFGADL